MAAPLLDFDGRLGYEPGSMSRSEEDRKSERLFDKRTLERNLRKGLVSPKDVEKRMEALPDLQAKVAPPPPELHLTPMLAPAPSSSLPTYNIVSNGSRKDAFASSLADDDDTELLDDEDDDLDEDEDDEDEDLDEDDDLPEAG